MDCSLLTWKKVVMAPTSKVRKTREVETWMWGLIADVWAA